MAQSTRDRLRLVLAQLIRQIKVPMGRGEKYPFPKLRNFILDVTAEGARQKTIHLLLVADIAPLRKQLGEHRLKTGESISITSYIAKCFASAIENDKRIQSRRLGRSRLIAFDDVDLAFLMEREWEG